MSRPYHLTPGASQGNAFTRHIYGGPSVFATRTKAGPGVNAFAVKPLSEKQLDGKVNITYSKRGSR